MKKLFILAIGAFAMASCNQEAVKKAEVAATQQRDSLEQIIAQKDNEINDMMTTLSDIEEGFREITEAQSRVTLAKQGEGTNTMVRIKENMQFIQAAMKQNKELINKLKQQVRESTVKGTELKKIIDNLTQQMETKDKQIQTLREELDKKDIHIAELKEQNILSSGEVLRSNFNKEYFTKIDIRIDKEIKLYSKSAEILTSHPASSYTLQRDANKQYVLRITNPEAFWATSKYLVILVK